MKGKQDGNILQSLWQLSSQLRAPDQLESQQPESRQCSAARDPMTPGASLGPTFIPSAMAIMADVAIVPGTWIPITWLPRTMVAIAYSEQVPSTGQWKGLCSNDLMLQEGSRVFFSSVPIVSKHQASHSPLLLGHLPQEYQEGGEGKCFLGGHAGLPKAWMGNS